MKIHIVQKGDTLWKIAKKYGVNFEELKKMNSHLSNPDMIMPGMKIKIPTTSGNIQKEGLVGGKTEGKVQIAGKKEMQKVEHPFAKGKPSPVTPKEAPIKEAPQMPLMPEAPNVELPKEEIPPKKEVPKKPFVPKMPKPIIPEIDINNYYMMNMAQLNLPPQTQLPPQPQPKPLPEIPPEPKKILKETKPFVPEEESKKESPMKSIEHQGGYKMPMFPNQQNFSPVMPGALYPFPGGFPQQQGTQVQGAATAPMYYGGMPGVAGSYALPQTTPFDYDESSSFMPQMPYGMGQTQGAMGAQGFQDPMMMQMANMANLPQMPAKPQTGPAFTAPVMQGQYPCPPFQTSLYPISPVLPGPGPIPAYGQPYFGNQAMPLVMGAQEEYESPELYGNMPYQMPMFPQQPAVQGMGMPTGDCGCGGQQMMGVFNPGMGFSSPWGMAGMYNPQFGGMAPALTQPYGVPFANPYGPMGGTGDLNMGSMDMAMGMPREENGSNEENES